MRLNVGTSFLILIGLIVFGACGRVDHLGRPPSFSANKETPEHVAMLWPGLPLTTQTVRTVDRASLWSRDIWMSRLA